MTRRPVVVAVALAAAWLGAGGAAAQQIDLSKGGPIQVTARGGFEWRENQQIVIATDDARAQQGDTVVTADKLTAFYRKKATATATPAAVKPAPAADATDTGGNEVYRLEAEGHVLISTPTDQAQGDHAVYDIDQAVLVLTGHDLKLTTPQDVVTARDVMEYWSQKHMAVARGNAVVVTTDGRRVAGDVLVAYTRDNAPPAGPAPAPAIVTATPAAAPSDSLASSGKLERVEAFGNVEVRTATDVARGDRGVYVTDTGMARIVGHVRITHGENQSNGPAADVNMKTGIAHLVATPSERVNGLIMPNDAQSATTTGGAATTTGGAPKPAGKQP